MMPLLATFNKISNIVLVVFVLFAPLGVNAQMVNIVYTSDVHFGVTRPAFRGDSNVSSYKVNAALVKQINTIPSIVLPNDKGINGGKRVNNIDYFIETGDITNRMDAHVQTAAASWKEFETDYIKGLTLKGQNGRPATMLIVPGNHDASNAIGSPKTMTPATDPSSMVNIYNMMMKPARPITNQTYNYATDKVNYSVNVSGIHLVFITIWPDSAERIWMQKDLKNIPATTPVILFAHDPPAGDVKHFTNPVLPYGLGGPMKFENLVAEHYKEAINADSKGATDIEQRGWVKFLKAHPNIKAYFHGHSNYTEFYTYKGPDNDVNLPTFRVDSPMKGKYSNSDEKLLSFQLISLDTQKQMLTVRECLWNTDPANATQKVVFGKSCTVSVKIN